MSQIGLPFDWARQISEGGFLAGDANMLALRHIEGWQDWPLPVAIVSGPARSGKSLLGRYFATISGGTVIDDSERRADEALFHAWNRARDSGSPLLLISRDLPEAWPVTLPDLKSRLAAAPHVRIGEPDDRLMQALIERGLAQGGAAFSSDVPAWLARRTERSYAAIASLLEWLNTLSLASLRKISVPLLKEEMQNSGFLPIASENLEEISDPDQYGKSSDNV